MSCSVPVYSKVALDLAWAARPVRRRRAVTDLDIIQAFLTEHYLGIVMEFVGGGDMFEYVVKKNGLKEEEARYGGKAVR